MGTPRLPESNSPVSVLGGMPESYWPPGIFELVVRRGTS